MSNNDVCVCGAVRSAHRQVSVGGMFFCPPTGQRLTAFRLVPKTTLDVGRAKTVKLHTRFTIMPPASSRLL